MVDEYDFLMNKVYQVTGYDFRKYKDSTIRRRLAKRLKETNCATFRDYINYLDEKREEYSCLISTLMVKVTQFFRDREDWELIRREVLPKIIKGSAGRLNIWSIACASGEEPYSLAILFYEILGNRIGKFEIKIYATDIDEDSLRKARKGIYRERSLRNVDAELIKKYFSHLSEGEYKIKENVKSMVRFFRHSIVEGEEFSGFEFIVCRNLLIYFTRELQEKIYLKLYNALKPGGFLWLGRAEVPIGEAGELLKALFYKERIYQKG
jgi:chemotaxis methyl-accepting protein methylase